MINPLIVSVIGSIVMEYHESFIDAHRLMVSMLYSTDNGDVGVLFDGDSHLARSPEDINRWRSNPNISPITIKTRDIEYFDRTLLNTSVSILHSVNNPNISKCSYHILEAEAGSISFPDHVDPIDIVMVVIDGTKGMWITEDGCPRLHILNKGDYLHVPANTIHRAENTHSSIMVSVGLERFIKDHVDTRVGGI